MPGNIGWQGVLIILLVLLVIFGPKRLPEMGRSLGRGIREFKDSITGNDKDEEPEKVELAPPPATTAAGTQDRAAQPESERVSR
jgi:sec-independent protein translocase protein TatA